MNGPASPAPKAKSVNSVTTLPQTSSLASGLHLVFTFRLSFLLAGTPTTHRRRKNPCKYASKATTLTAIKARALFARSTKSAKTQQTDLWTAMKVLNRLRLGITHVLRVQKTSTTTRQQKHALLFPQELAPSIPCSLKRNASMELTQAALQSEPPRRLTAYLAQKERNARVQRLQQMGKAPVHKVTGAAQEMRTIQA